MNNFVHTFPFHLITAIPVQKVVLQFARTTRGQIMEHCKMYHNVYEIDSLRWKLAVHSTTYYLLCRIRNKVKMRVCIWSTRFFIDFSVLISFLQKSTCVSAGILPICTEFQDFTTSPVYPFIINMPVNLTANMVNTSFE